MHKCEILYFNNIIVEVYIIIQNKGKIFVNNAVYNEYSL